MTNLCNFNEYVSRMTSSLQSKLKILKHFPENPKSILDFGCGSGMLTSALSDLFPSAFVLGYDCEPKMVEVAEDNFPHCSFTCSMPISKKWDVIVLSSVLHEIFSYDYGMDAVVEFMSNMYNLLNDGGRIVVREGVANAFHKNDTVDIFPVNPYEFSAFYKRYVASWKYSKDEYIVDRDDFGGIIRITGKINPIKEMMNKYTWGEKSFPREIQEQIYFADLNTFLSICEGKKSIEIITDGEYFKYLDKKVEYSRTWITHAIVSYTKI